MKLEIQLPFPDPRLNPNRKNGTHWSTTIKEKKAARDYAFYVTKEAMESEALPKHLGSIALEITFVEPDKNRRDIDNLLAASKSAIDGMAMALKVDDQFFNPVTLNRLYAPGNGKMLVSVVVEGP